MPYLSVVENLKNYYEISRIHERLLFHHNCLRHSRLPSARDRTVKMHHVVLFRANHVHCCHFPAVNDSGCTSHAGLKLPRIPFRDREFWRSWGFLPFRKCFISCLGLLVLGNRLEWVFVKIRVEHSICLLLLTQASLCCDTFLINCWWGFILEEIKI